MTIPKRLFGRLIGRRIRIIMSRDPTLVGISGIITYETRNMLEIQLQNGQRIFVQKKICVFEIYCDKKKSPYFRERPSTFNIPLVS